MLIKLFDANYELFLGWLLSSDRSVPEGKIQFDAPLHGCFYYF